MTEIAQASQAVGTSDTLGALLDQRGWAPRPQQRTLYETMRSLALGEQSVIQAATGSGKSLALLAAAVDQRMRTDSPVVILTPTKQLMNQYEMSDLPLVREVTGLDVQLLKGASSYLCPQSPGFLSKSRKSKDKDQIETYREIVEREGVIQVSDSWMGCPRGPGSPKPHKKSEESKCHANRARKRAKKADIVVTNVNLWLWNTDLNGLLLPEYQVLFLDEAHAVDPVMREHLVTQIASSELIALQLSRGLDLDSDSNTDLRPYIEPLLGLLAAEKRGGADLNRGDIGAALEQLGKMPPRYNAKGAVLSDPAAVKTAREILTSAEHGALTYKHMSLHLNRFGPGGELDPTLMVTWLDPGWHPRGYLRAWPPGAEPRGKRELGRAVGAVSGTISGTLPMALGMGKAPMVDIGHPFDYARQAKLFVSSLNGGSAAVRRDGMNVPRRAGELVAGIESTDGGVLVLFSSMADLEDVRWRISPEITRMGRLLLIQESGMSAGQRSELGQRFRSDGFAVLLGSDTFATGFDVQGPALSTVVLWKLPYLAPTPVTEAMNHVRVRDLMRTKAVQACGRLIRSHTDTGRILVLDSRAEHDLLVDEPISRWLLEIPRLSRPDEV